MLAGVAAVLLLLGNNVRWAQPQPQPQQRAGQLAPAALTDAWVPTTFTDGRVLGEGMHVLGLTLGGGPGAFVPLAGDPLVFTPGRDARGAAWAGGDPRADRIANITVRLPSSRRPARVEQFNGGDRATNTYDEAYRRLAVKGMLRYPVRPASPIWLLSLSA